MFFSILVGNLHLFPFWLDRIRISIPGQLPWLHVFLQYLICDFVPPLLKCFYIFLHHADTHFLKFTCCESARLVVIVQLLQLFFIVLKVG